MSGPILFLFTHLSLSYQAISAPLSLLHIPLYPLLLTLVDV